MYTKQRRYGSFFSAAIALGIGLFMFGAILHNWVYPARAADSRGQQRIKADKAYEKFIRETRELRQELAGKEAEYYAIMYRVNPDPDWAGQLAKEIAALRDKIEEKARTYKISGPIPYQPPPQPPVGGYGYWPRWRWRPWCTGGYYWPRLIPDPTGGAWGNYGPSVTSTKAYHDFMRETSNLRQELASKQAEYYAVMYQMNPNPDYVGQLAKEIAELQDKIEERARAHGLPSPSNYTP